MANPKIAVEVVYALPTQQHCMRLSVDLGATVAEVIAASGILQQCPEIDLNQHKVGIFSKVVALSQPVQAGDRVEIYRPLLLDPKELRRIKARKP